MKAEKFYRKRGLRKPTSILIVERKNWLRLETNKELKNLDNIHERLKKIRYRIKKVWKGSIKGNIKLYIKNSNRFITNHNHVTSEESYRIDRYNYKEVSEELFRNIDGKVKLVKKNINLKLEKIKRNQIIDNIKKRQRLVMDDPGRFIRKIFDNKKRHVIDFT
jgi:hypothetical protein